ncbi:MAG: Cytidylyltransferase family protein [Methanoregula sp. PtaU1.Bin051]|nr:MAG: Cytidylyltransferase family protein [Methanoregula sp. PtaU1.Bin051]
MDETARKILHIVFGIGIAALVFCCGRDISLLILSVVLLTGLILSDAISRGHHIPLVSGIVAEVERPDVVPGKGALLFFVSSLVCLVLFPQPVVIPAILALAISDGISTIAGLRYGRTRIRNGKSIEGAFSGFAATGIVLLAVLPPVSAMLAAAVASVVEIISPVDDNLTVPVAVAIILTLLPTAP